MNLSHVEFELAEALIHLHALVAKFREHRVRPDDSPELAVELGHIMDHLCFTWNSRGMSHEELLAMPQAEFERLSNTVPNFQATRIMGETACC